MLQLDRGTDHAAGESIRQYSATPAIQVTARRCRRVVIETRGTSSVSVDELGPDYFAEDEGLRFWQASPDDPDPVAPIDDRADIALFLDEIGEPEEDDDWSGSASQRPDRSVESLFVSYEDSTLYKQTPDSYEDRSNDAATAWLREHDPLRNTATLEMIAQAALDAAGVDRAHLFRAGRPNQETRDHRTAARDALRPIWDKAETNRSRLALALGCSEVALRKLMSSS